MDNPERACRVTIKTIDGDGCRQVTKREADTLPNAILDAIGGHRGWVDGDARQLLCDILDSYGIWMEGEYPEDPEECAAFNRVESAAKEYLDIVKKNLDARMTRPRMKKPSPK